MPATSTRHSGWQFRQAGGHQGNSDISAVYEGTEVTRMTGSAYTINLHTLIGTSSNSGVTLGLTIDQGANTDSLLEFKNSSLAHGITTRAETDVLGSIKRHGNGGMVIEGYANGEVALRFRGHMTTANTDHDATGSAAVEIDGLIKSGTSSTDVTSNGNILAVRNNSTTAFIVDAEGDLFANGSAATVYDDMPDAMMVRAVDRAKRDNGARGYIEGQWDDYTIANEQALVETGILGAPLAEGGLINVTRLQQLHNGAIWQLWTDVLDVAKALPAAAQEKLPARIKDRFLALSTG
jgi:hypothetical protein